MFEAAGVHLQLCSITSIGVPVVIGGQPRHHRVHVPRARGDGRRSRTPRSRPSARSPSARRAARSTSSRCARTSSPRTCPTSGRRPTASASRRSTRRRGRGRPAAETIALADEATFRSDDVAADLGVHARSPGGGGPAWVIAVDLSPPELPVGRPGDRARHRVVGLGSLEGRPARDPGLQPGAPESEAADAPRGHLRGPGASPRPTPRAGSTSSAFRRSSAATRRAAGAPGAPGRDRDHRRRVPPGPRSRPRRCSGPSTPASRCSAPRAWARSAPPSAPATA